MNLKGRKLNSFLSSYLDNVMIYKTTLMWDDSNIFKLFLNLSLLSILNREKGKVHRSKACTLEV